MWTVVNVECFCQFHLAAWPSGAITAGQRRILEVPESSPEALGASTAPATRKRCCATTRNMQRSLESSTAQRHPGRRVRGPSTPPSEASAKAVDDDALQNGTGSTALNRPAPAQPTHAREASAAGGAGNSDAPNGRALQSGIGDTAADRPAPARPTRAREAGATREANGTDAPQGRGTGSTPLGAGFAFLLVRAAAMKRFSSRMSSRAPTAQCLTGEHLRGHARRRRTTTRGGRRGGACLNRRPQMRARADRIDSSMA